ncbi:MAG: SUMF1/EgtB/PvdO family nonheme iron enzyme [Lewinellaceae bacterium]|nr:SUMF1/EgtB/PvdO family nonheme iron enzyme [Lewinellaceae bacterium]
MSNKKPTRIFISYRWEYTYHEAKNLQRAIEARFEDVRVFRDEERATPGNSITEEIVGALKETNLVLALLHEGWQRQPPKSPGCYQNKFFKEDDWVRLELDLAKNELGKKVVPVLCNGASLPPRNDQIELNGVLPECLHFLSDDIIALEMGRANKSEAGILDYLEKEFQLVRKKQPEKAVLKNRLRDEGLELPDKMPDKKAVPKPFLGLPYFEEKHARLFFGRSNEICDLWDMLERKPHRLILLHGYSGVGKSSLLNAGLFPRMKHKGWTVVGRRRQKDRSLCRLLEDDMLLQVSQNEKTLLAIDQLEEAMIEPFEDKEELPPFFSLLEKAMKENPRLKVLLGFRKEFLPEIQKQVPEALKGHTQGYFLEPLDDGSILEAIRLDDKLKDHYAFEFEPGLEEKIAAGIVERDAQLYSGETSSKAPWLQMLLLNLWDTAANRTGQFEKLKLTGQDFKAVRQNNFPSLVNTQLDKLELEPEPHSTYFQKGLTLDLLHFLTTIGGTAAIRADAELRQRYAVPQAELTAHLRRLENLQLVTRVADRDDQLYTRLAHDALAPVIRKRHEQSDKPVQHAHRIFQSKKTVAPTGQAAYIPIQDKDDILLLREAKAFMYRWPAEAQAAFEQGAAEVEKREAELRDKTASIFDSFAGVGAGLIQSLDHAQALGKLKIAMKVDIDFELKKEKLRQPLEELLFFFAEGGRRTGLARAAAELLLQLEPRETLAAALRQCLAEEWAERSQFDPLLRELPSFSTLQSRYYPQMIAIPTGKDGIFDMGSPESESGRYSDELLHKVKLSPYHMAATPTTFYQYALYCEAEDKSIASKTPSWGRFGNHPLVNVSWYEAVGFCNWLSGQAGLTACYNILEEKDSDKNNQVQNDYLKWKVNLDKKADGFRLPTEAEWELAARSGCPARRPLYAGSDNLDEVGWFWENSGDKPLSGDWDINRVLNNNCRTHAVKEKGKHNGIGLYDMSGNVYEWCWDWYGEAYYKECQARGVEIDPPGPESSSSGRVVRGGSWYGNARNCRIAFRNRGVPDNRDSSIGFRLVFVPQSG